MKRLMIGIELALITCGSFIASTNSAQALTILGSFTFNDVIVQTTFPPDNQTIIPADTVDFNFDTNTNTGSATGFNIIPFSNVNGTIITGTGFSTFDPVTNLFDVYVARYDFNGDGSILVDFRADFDGLSSGGVTPFTLTTVNADGTVNSTQFISATDNLTSFNQAIPIPFEFSPAIGLSLVGGLVLAQKLRSKNKVKSTV